MGMCRAEGIIKNVNTIEEFKNADRPGMVNRCAQMVSPPLCRRAENHKADFHYLGLGCDSRWNDLLVPFTTYLICRYLLRRLEEVQIPLPFRLSGTTVFTKLGHRARSSHREAGTRAKLRSIRATIYLEILCRYSAAWVFSGQANQGRAR